jgi:hypothetical protein
VNILPSDVSSSISPLQSNASGKDTFRMYPAIKSENGNERELDEVIEKQKIN